MSYEPTTTVYCEVHGEYTSLPGVSIVGIDGQLLPVPICANCWRDMSIEGRAKYCEDVRFHRRIMAAVNQLCLAAQEAAIEAEEPDE